MKHNKRILLPAIILGVVIFTLRCANEPNSIAAGTTELLPTVLWKAGGIAVVPDAVDSIRIQVTYGTITVSRTLPFAANHAVFPSLPTGETVDILFEGLDAARVVIYRGTVNGVILSGLTKEVTITAELLTPRAPANLQATAISPTAIRLTWDDSSSSETGFIIYRGTVAVDTVLANRTIYNDTGLAASTAYSYTVRAYNAAGLSLTSSNQASATTLATGSNSAPQFTTATREALLKDTLLYRGARYARRLVASDPDTGDILTITASSQFSGLPDSIVWTPADTGWFNAWVKVSDGAASDSLGWRVHVVDTTTVRRGLDSGLVAYYPFNGNPNDESENSFNGTEMNGPLLTMDRFGNLNSAYAFDGIDDGIDVPYDTLDFTADFALCMWVWCADSGKAGLFHNRYFLKLGKDQGYALSRTDFRIGNGIDYTNRLSFGDAPLGIREWHFIVAQRKQGLQSVYVDNVLVASMAISGSPPYHVDNVNHRIGVGVSGVGGLHHGKIDDFRIYSRGLTDVEIDSLFRQGGLDWQAPETVTDADGNIYSTVAIGNQVWTVENLRTTRFNDGSSIPHITDSIEWSNLSQSAYCFYNNTIDSDSITKFGALYNWDAVNTGKLAPVGWHVPSDEEWDTLKDYLIANGYNWDQSTIENKIGKSLAAQTDWAVSTTDGAIGNNQAINNISGFAGFPGGYANYNGGFLSFNVSATWWTSTSTENDTSSAVYRGLYYNDDYLRNNDRNRSFGFSVRLVKDSQ